MNEPTELQRRLEELTFAYEAAMRELGLSDEAIRLIKLNVATRLTEQSRTSN